VARSRRNEEFLPGVELPAGVRVTADLEDTLPCEILLVAVPSHGFRAVLHRFLELDGEPPGGGPRVVVSAAKGIEADSLARMSQVTFEEALAADREVDFAVLSGPSFAAELARGMATVSVVASESADLARMLQSELSSPTFRLYSSADVVGVELGGSAKNVIAIAAGAVAGLGLGQNTLAALITRGLHEITRLGIAFGGQPRTFAGLAGLGDLVLTCTGSLSRNRALGVALAEGKSLEELTSGTHMVAEGVRNARTVTALARKRGVEMPICEQMEEILYEGKSPAQAVHELMTRDLKSETEL
jgi:glycerol-3-phosphate dehydrogenase (NAD(P)+)